MVLIIIMMFTMLVLWGSLAAAYGVASPENGRYLLGITIPKEYRGAPEVQAVLTGYRKTCRRITWWGFAGCFLVIPLNGFLSILILFMMGWFAFLYHLYNENIRQNARRLYEIKRKKGWLSGNTHPVTVDSVLKNLGKKGTVSAWWLVLPWILSAAGWYLSWNAGGGQLLTIAGIACTAAAMTAFTCAYLGIRRMKPQAFCAQEEACRTINCAIQREWSRCMAIHCYGIAALVLVPALSLVPALPLVNASAGWPPLLSGTSAAGRLDGIILLLFLCAAGSGAAVYAAHYRVRKVKDRIFEALPEDGAGAYGDEDEYWLNGTGGRKSSGRLEEKRMGIGMTTNNTLVPTVGEKAIWIIMFLVVAGISIFMMPFDFTRITMNIDGGRCRVQAASMGYTIDLDQVQEVTLLDQRPEMSKKHGYDSNRFYLGDFRVKDYGTCKVYVGLKSQPVIKVETADDIVWFNGATQEETEAFYRELSQALLKK